MRVEMVTLSSTHVDRTKEIYVDQIGLNLDHDIEPGNGMLVARFAMAVRQVLRGIGCDTLGRHVRKDLREDASDVVRVAWAPHMEHYLLHRSSG